MFNRWITTLSLALCVLGSASGQGEAPPAASLGRPIAVSRQAAAPAATLGRPVVAATPARSDTGVRPASFSTRPSARGAAPDEGPRPMPVDDTAVSQWRRGSVIANTPRTVSSGQVESVPIGPTPLVPTPGPVVSGPVSGPVGGPVLGPAPGPTTLFGEGAGAFGGGCGHGQCLPGAALAPWGGGSRLSVGVDYLLWWVRGDRTPPLVTTGPAIPGQVTGILGQPGTSILYGNSQLNDGARSGARLNAVWWFNEEHCWGLDFSGFFVGENSDNFSAFSNGDPVLARPFSDLSPLSPNLRAIGADGTVGTQVNPLFGMQNVEKVANPTDGIASDLNSGALAGGVDISHRSTLWGYDMNLRRGLCYGENWYFDMLFGFRQLGLDESLSITERLVATGPVVGLVGGQTPVIVQPSGTSLVINDKFSATNRFYGAQMGFDTQWQRGRWSLGMRSKLGLGTTQQIVTIDGSTRITPPVQFGAGSSTPGGLLALPGTNIGRYSRNVFGVVPEVGMSLGYQFTPWLRGTVGYNFLYWNNVTRPGGTIDTAVNRTFQGSSILPSSGAARPAFRFDGTELWVHGLTLGLECRF